MVNLLLRRQKVRHYAQESDYLLFIEGEESADIITIKDTEAQLKEDDAVDYYFKIPVNLYEQISS